MDYQALAAQLARQQRELQEMGADETDPARLRLAVGKYLATDTFRAIEWHACVCREEDRALFAVTGPAGDPKSERVAALFAAAPELLAACRGILNPFGHTDGCWENRTLGVEHCSKACQRIRDAVERATGKALPSGPMLPDPFAEPSDDPPPGVDWQDCGTLPEDPFGDD